MFIISVQVFDKLRQEAMSSIIDRNPRAFKPKIAQSPVRTIEYSLKWQLNLLDCAEVISAIYRCFNADCGFICESSVHAA